MIQDRWRVGSKKRINFAMDFRRRQRPNYIRKRMDYDVGASGNTKTTSLSDTILIRQEDNSKSETSGTTGDTGGSGRGPTIPTIGRGSGGTSSSNKNRSYWGRVKHDWKNDKTGQDEISFDNLADAGRVGQHIGSALLGNPQSQEDIYGKGTVGASLGFGAGLVVGEIVDFPWDVVDTSQYAVHQVLNDFMPGGKEGNWSGIGKRFNRNFKGSVEWNVVDTAQYAVHQIGNGIMPGGKDGNWKGMGKRVKKDFGHMDPNGVLKQGFKKTGIAHDVTHLGSDIKDSKIADVSRDVGHAVTGAAHTVGHAFGKIF
jgi:hypothetical protein